MIQSLLRATALAAAFAFAGNALADGAPRGGSVKDAPLPAAFTWSGFYIGATAGASFDNFENTLRTVNGPVTLYSPAESIAVNAAGTRTFDDTNVAYGVKVGYNRQHGSLVMGVELDFTSIYKDQHRITTGQFPGFVNPSSVLTFDQRASIDSLVTLRPRLGVAFDKTHLYVTGGVAIGHVKFSSAHREFAPNGLGFGTSLSADSATRVGWALGAGGEYAFTPNFIFGIEYLHVDLGSISSSGLVTSLNATTAFHNNRTEFTTDIVRASLSYKF